MISITKSKTKAMSKLKAFANNKFSIFVYKSLIHDRNKNSKPMMTFDALMKTLWEKKKMLITSIFYFSNNVFYPVKDKFNIWTLD